MTRIVNKAAGVFILDDSYTILREPGNRNKVVLMYEGVLSAKDREQSMSYMVLNIPASKELDAETILKAADEALKTLADHNESLIRRK